jgi:aspartate/methionine/tyrosine aminotransferase
LEFKPFEYMAFAKSAARGARISLTLSGLTPPPVEWLGDPAAIVDLRDAGATGTLPLRERIATRYGMKPDEVFVVPGASAGIHIASAALCDAGCDALVERPVYPPLWSEPELFGARVTFVDRPMATQHSLDRAAVEAALAKARKPNILFFTNLNNPTGALSNDAQLSALGETAMRAGARAVCCELYGDFLGPARPKSIASLVSGAVSIGSLTKAYGLGALRVGWILCKDRSLLSRMESIFDHMDVNCAMPSLRAAEAALDRVGVFERRAAEVAGAGYAVFSEWLGRERGRVRCAPTPGGIIAFPQLLGVADTQQFAARVRERHGVQLTPGEFFAAPGHLRIGFGSDPKIVAEGLAAVSAELPRETQR